MIFLTYAIGILIFAALIGIVTRLFKE
ncbi:MAG: potassium transporter KtrB [Roseovarius sp. BRH_c41]|nr:potassium-transporting ATPase subunit B [Roseovarius sp. 217]KJS45776.1 MAG: potassium transporter KtrB [Roseovarius sp. BRH_c41]